MRLRLVQPQVNTSNFFEGDIAHLENQRRRLIEIIELIIALRDEVSPRKKKKHISVEKYWRNYLTQIDLTISKLKDLQREFNQDDSVSLERKIFHATYLGRAMRKKHREIDQAYEKLSRCVEAMEKGQTLDPPGVLTA